MSGASHVTDALPSRVRAAVPDDDVRLSLLGRATFLETYASHGIVWTSVLNGLMQDHRLECEMRRVPDAVLPR